MQNDSLTIKLVINQYVKIVLQLFNINGDVDAHALYFERNRLRVVLVFKEKSEFVINLRQLVRNERKWNFDFTVTVNFDCPLEIHLSQKLLKLNLFLCKSSYSYKFRRWNHIRFTFCSDHWLLLLFSFLILFVLFCFEPCLFTFNLKLFLPFHEIC